MAIHKGEIYTLGDVSLREPNLDNIEKQNPVNYTNLDWKSWREKAKSDNSVYYFAIYYKGLLVGEIFLHDINLEEKEALLGYHIFDPSNHGKGIGSMSLKLLQKFVSDQNLLKKLIIITSEDNLPSRRIAEKAGFALDGPSHEDPKKVVYYWHAS